MDGQTPKRFSRLRPTSPLGVLLLGGALLVLLGLVAAASRAHQIPGSHAGVHQPPSGVGDYLFSIIALLAVCGALVLFYIWFSERDLLARQRTRKGGTIRALAVVLAFALLAALIARFHVHFGDALNRLANRNLTGGAKSLKGLGHSKGQPTPPEFKWLPVFIATAGGLSVLGVIGVRSIRRSRLGLREAYLLEQEFAELVEDTLADLYAEKDPRRAIIAAYARVERIFATYGLPRDPSEAPVEYLERVLGELRASGAALRRLTGLFEWAKFSAHDVEPRMRDEAIGALLEVRDELRANRVEDEQRAVTA
jgi:multisubunit Na+/H+ antiporter MnhB subunit